MNNLKDKIPRKQKSFFYFPHKFNGIEFDFYLVFPHHWQYLFVKFKDLKMFRDF